MIIRLILLAALVSLAGCSVFQKKEPTKEVVIETTEYVFIRPPENLVRDCQIDAPPDKKAFVDATPKERQQMLVEYAGKQTLNLGLCNNDKKALRNWSDELADIYKDK